MPVTDHPEAFSAHLEDDDVQALGKRRYDVIRQSGGESTYEETCHTESREDALRQFHARYDQPDEDGA